MEERDKLLLVRGAAVELLMFYCARFYSVADKTFTIGNMIYSEKDLKNIGFSDVSRILKK